MGRTHTQTHTYIRMQEHKNSSISTISSVSSKNNTINTHPHSKHTHTTDTYTHNKPTPNEITYTADLCVCPNTILIIIYYYALTIDEFEADTKIIIIIINCSVNPCD